MVHTIPRHGIYPTYHGACHGVLADALQETVWAALPKAVSLPPWGMSVCSYVGTYVCMYLSMYLPMYVCSYVCRYVCMYVGR